MECNETSRGNIHLGHDATGLRPPEGERLPGNRAHAHAHASGLARTRSPSTCTRSRSHPPTGAGPAPYLASPAQNYLVSTGHIHPSISHALRWERGAWKMATIPKDEAADPLCFPLITLAGGDRVGCPVTCLDVTSQDARGASIAYAPL